MPFTHVPGRLIASCVPSHYQELFSFDEAELETVRVGSEDVHIGLVGFLYGQVDRGRGPHDQISDHVDG